MTRRLEPPPSSASPSRSRTAAILVGATTTLTATTKDASGNTLTGTTVTWTTSSATIATVSQAGVCHWRCAGNGDHHGDEQRKDGYGDGHRELEDRDLHGDAEPCQRSAAECIDRNRDVHGNARYHDESVHVRVTFTGLTTNVTLGHIHGPAVGWLRTPEQRSTSRRSPGATFSVGATAGTAHGVTTLNTATAITATMTGDSLKKLLFAGLTYANIHTTQNGGGEIRGQIARQ